MSVLGKNWIIKNSNPSMTVMEKLMANRGFSGLDETTSFNDPFLFKDMKVAVERIVRAIENKERIIIFGDYDVDGITGTAILVHTLRKLKANVSYRIPNRLKDGYGLSEKFIDEFKEKNVKLLITVDCGISCKNAIEKAKSYGIDSIVTDHHTIPKHIPDKAIAIIHPKYDNSYPYEHLTGAGVALKLAHGLTGEESFIFTLTDLAALGTVADLGPLKGENRFIVKKGLEILNKTKWAGLQKIIDLSSLDKDKAIDTYSVGFRIAPRINAAGRIGDPYLALSLLLQEEKNEKINALGEALEKLNSQRQDMTANSLAEAEETLLKNGEIPPVIIVGNENWHVGIIGLIAGKLAEKYARPAIIMQDMGETLVASARSPGYFDIISAMTKFGDHLIAFGGHAQAAGFSIKKENLSLFSEKLIEYAAKKLKKMDIKPTIEIDCKLEGKDIHQNLVNEIEELEPFGVGNSSPTFVLENISPKFINRVGKSKEHLKFSITVNNQNIEAIAFKMGEFADAIRGHKNMDIVGSLNNHIWNGRKSMELKVMDFKIFN
ncbi:single-stranded-DNA-specific exonuclease RecJ [Candidatus Peregrinibacteria bacterium]|nr:single-stranded-DNA-specific exonuclease RecJ [Candidatus Peregrinibacteria bacterium]